MLLCSVRVRCLCIRARSPTSTHLWQPACHPVWPTLTQHVRLGRATLASFFVQALLRDRGVVNDDDGHVTFRETGAQRISAADALKHRFTRFAAEPGTGTDPGTSQRGAGSRARGGSATTGRTEQLSPEPSAFGAAVSMWRNLTGKVFDLEAKVSTQRSATRTMTVKVKKLKNAAARGDAAAADRVAQEEARLLRMERRLGGLEEDLTSATSAVSGIMRFFGGGADRGGSAGGGTAPGSPGRRRGSQQRVEEGGSMSGGGSGALEQRRKLAMWKKLAARINAVEGKLSNQESAVTKQSFTVKKLRMKVDAGVADPDMLDRAEKVLTKVSRPYRERERERERGRRRKQGGGDVEPTLQMGRRLRGEGGLHIKLAKGDYLSVCV
eukprot:352677-Chlamydomonas_euryale.AAC.2